jgi:hypothetical protein
MARLRQLCFSQLMEVPPVDDLPRRIILRRALQITLAIAVAPHVIRPARAAGSCVDPASESLRNSLHYVSATPNASQPCNACGFFTGEGSKSACGNCMIMSGPVDANGHCDSWAARSS